MKLTHGLTAIAAFAVATPAFADKHNFEICDGLRAPGDKDLGMAGPVSTGANFVVGNTAAAAITSCTDALADPRLKPEATLRRAHLLRARALDRLQTGDADGALADLDAAAAAAAALASDPLHRRSLGVSLTLARAAALVAKGDRSEARRLAAEAAAARPYSASIQRMAAVIAQRARDPQAPAPAGFAALLPLDPEALRFQFATDVEAGRFAEAASLYPRLHLAFPSAGQAIVALAALPGDVRTLVSSISTGADTAYAYAASGEPRAARDVLTTGTTKLEAALVPAKGKDGAPLPPSQLAAPLREAWTRSSRLVEARIAIDEHRPLDALKALVGIEVPANAAGVDLLTSLRAALPADSRALAPDPAPLAARLAERRRAETVDTALLRSAMAAPETSRTLATYGKASSGFLSGLLPVAFSADGFTSKTDAATGDVTVSFVGQAASEPAVEELTLLRAADLARAAGRHGFVVVERRDYTRRLTTYSGFGHVPVSSVPSGFKTELVVRFVDAAALPADLTAERDRVIDADRVYATLAPVYIAPKPAG